MRAIIAAALVGGLCGLMGVYIVLRGMAYMGHGLAHAVFGGAAVSFIMSINFYLGATAWGFLSALLVTWITRKNPTIRSDASIGIITTSSFALGIAIISSQRRFTRDLDAALWGSVLGVQAVELLAIAAVAFVVAAVFFLGYKLFLFATFDAEVAQFYGVPTGWVDTVFSLMLAAAIVVSMQVLGVLMIAAAIVIPPIVARLLTNSFRQMVILSAGIGIACAVLGLYLSYLIELSYAAKVSPGPSVVLFSSALFVLTLLWSRLRSRLGRGGGLEQLPRESGSALE